MGGEGHGDLHISRSPAKFVEIFLQQSESLETIHLQSLHQGSLGVCFGGMKKLRVLDIELAVLFGYDTEFELKSIAIKELLPSTLELLILRYSANQASSEDRIAAIQRMLARKKQDLPRLRKITLLREGPRKSWDKQDADVVRPSIESICCDVGVELVTGGFYEEFNRWTQWIDNSPR